MSQRPIIAVYDKKIGAYESTHVARHIGDAIRDWDHIRKDPATKFGKHPEDFDLFELGTLDEETGIITPKSPFTHLASGV